MSYFFFLSTNGTCGLHNMIPTNICLKLPAVIQPGVVCDGAGLLQQPITDLHVSTYSSVLCAHCGGLTMT